MFYLSHITTYVSEYSLIAYMAKTLNKKTYSGIIEFMSRIFKKKTLKSNQQILLHFLNIN